MDVLVGLVALLHTLPGDLAFAFLGSPPDRARRCRLGSEARIAPEESHMVLCPVALAVGCRKCPIFSFCPVKTVIGDQKPEEKSAPKAPGGKKRG